MKILTTATVLAAIVLCACGSNQASINRDWGRVDKLLDESVTSNVLSGYGFAVFDSTGILHTKTGGDQQLDTTEVLASASKLPAAAAIMTLVDSGKLQLDEPVQTYLNGHITWPQDKSPITMRMLLNHTSGMVGLDAAIQPPCMQDARGTTLQDCAQQIANWPLRYSPGTTFNYSGVDYQLAGYVATVIAGTDNWQDFFNDAIITPLNLTSMTYGAPGLFPNPRIAGDLSSNVMDYTTFLQMIFANGSYKGTQVVTSDAVAEIEKNQLPQAVQFAFSPLPPTEYPGYGLGVFMVSDILHPGSPGPEYVDPGLLGTVAWVDRGLKYGGVLLITDTATAGIDVWNELQAILAPQVQ